MAASFDQTPYKSTLGELHRASRDEDERFVSLFDRPRSSDLNREMIALLCTGKYRTLWRGVPLMKDALSQVIFARMLQEIQPRTIFDLGTCGGASAMWLADQCRAQDLDATVLTIDIEDLRTKEVRERMEADPRIRFHLGDLTQLSSALPKEMLASLPHPWLVLEDAHVPTVPLLTHLHLYGLEEGDYVVFEDTHLEGPNISGMGAHDKESYETGFGAQKTREVALAMCVYPLEYKVDTRYTDMFGLNATFMPNSIFRRVEPAETARVLEFDQYDALSPAEVERCLVEDGHVLLRPRGDIGEIPYGLLPRLLGVTKHNLYEQGSELRSAGEDPRYLEVTRFPADQWIPPHHELYYTPMSPARAAFVCLAPPRVGGETSLYDGRQAWRLLSPALKARLASQRVLWRRRLGPPGEVRALENTSWSRAFGTSNFEEAQRLARAEGYSISKIDEDAKVITIDYLAWMGKDDCLATSIVGNHPWIYEKFYGGAETSHEEPLWEDGTKLTEDELVGMLEAYARARVQARWTRRGEVLMLDNRRFAHGRQPWAGPKREILVMMGS